MFYIFRHSIISLCNPACYASQRIAIATQRNSQTDGMLEIRTIQKGDDRFGNGTLATFIKMIGGAYLVTGTVQVIKESGFDIIFNTLLTFSCTCQINSCSSSLCPFYPLGMVVSDHGCLFCYLQRLFQRIEHPSDSTYPHRRTIAPTIIRLRIFFTKPTAKTSAITTCRIWIFTSVPLHNLHQVSPIQQPARNGHCHNCIVGIIAFVRKQREVRCLYIIKLINGANDVSCYCTCHNSILLQSFNLLFTNNPVRTELFPFTGLTGNPHPQTVKLVDSLFHQFFH